MCIPLHNVSIQTANYETINHSFLSHTVRGMSYIKVGHGRVDSARITHKFPLNLAVSTEHMAANSLEDATC
jgi:hypothetical protein